MNSFSLTGCIIVMQLLFTFNSSAQTKTSANTLQPPPANIKIDGNLKDWGDSLRYYNANLKMNYALANDKNNLYIAVRINDRFNQIRVLNGGLTLGINTKGKKSSPYTVTYPAPDPNASHTGSLLGHTPDGNGITQADRDDLAAARLNRLRDMELSGFKDVESNMVTTSNTYGFKFDIDYDASGALVYEAAIPLKFLGEYQTNKDAWAFNFKINGMKPNENNNRQASNESGMSGGGRRGGGMGGGRRGGGMGGGMRGGGAKPADGEAATHNELSKSTDFEEKFYLAD
jgi:hypothetical protein